MFCPDWVFDIVCAEVASLYLKNDVALALGAGKYTSFLSKEYEALSADEIAMASEEMIRLLGELEAGDAAVMLLEGFCYFRMMYSFQGVKRNLKPMFGSASSGTKKLLLEIVPVLPGGCFVQLTPFLSIKLLIICLPFKLLGKCSFL